MSNTKKGLRIGNYRITPLGLGVLGALIVIIIALIVLLVVNSSSGATKPPVTKPTASPTATVSAEPTAVPTPTPVPGPRSATIRALGEIAIETDLLKSAFDRETETFDFSPMFSEISSIMSDADYTIVDVEGTMGDTVSVSGNGAKMNTPSALIDALKKCGVDMINLANDHTLDAPFSELLATMENINEAGLSYIGASASAEERNTAVIREINGIKVGFLAYTTSVNNMGNASAEAKAYGLWHTANSNAMADIDRLRDSGADVIIACMSWGNMLNRTPNSEQQQIAQMLCAAGVDVIIGYNPHVVQPAYWLETPAADGTTHRTLCLCSLGNLLSNQRAQYADSSTIFEFTIQEQEYGVFTIESPTYIPTYVWRYQREDGLFDYRTLPAGQWTDDRAGDRPEGMTYEDLQRMGAIWTEVQNVIGANVATISRG